MVRRVTLVVPDTLWPYRQAHPSSFRNDLKLTALKKFKARSKVKTVDPREFHRRLFELFNIPVADQDDLPLAAVIRSIDSVAAPDCYYMFADPVHLRADRDSIVMMGNADLDIDEKESDGLLHIINTHLSTDGIHILPMSGHQHWCLSVPRPQKLHTYPLDQVVGRKIQDYMPYGEHGGYWRNALNEIQMLLNVSEINRKREQKGELAINSVWFWGGGVLPPMGDVSWTSVSGNDDVLRGLASLGGLDCEPLAADAESWLETAGPGEHLVVFDDARKSMHQADVEAWRNFMMALDTLWLAPLLELLKTNRLTDLTIYLDSNHCLQITPRLARHWWRDILSHKIEIKNTD